MQSQGVNTLYIYFFLTWILCEYIIACGSSPQQQLQFGCCPHQVFFFSFQLFCFWLYSLTFQDAKHSFLLLLFWFQSSPQRSRSSSPHSVPLCCKLWRRGKLNFEVYGYVIFKSVLLFFYTCLKINKRQSMNNFYSFNLLNTAIVLGFFFESSHLTRRPVGFSPQLLAGPNTGRVRYKFCYKSDPARK